MGMMVHRACVSIFPLFTSVVIALQFYLYKCTVPHDVTGNNACIHFIFSIFYVYMFCNCNMNYTFDKYISHRKCIFYYLNGRTLKVL